MLQCSTKQFLASLGIERLDFDPTRVDDEAYSPLHYLELLYKRVTAKARKVSILTIKLSYTHIMQTHPEVLQDSVNTVV